jgi:hypothetical protein
MGLTNDEAIKVLETMLKGIDNQPFTYNVERTMAIAVTGEALQMAIEALKSKEVVKEMK